MYKISGNVNFYREYHGKLESETEIRRKQFAKVKIQKVMC